MMDTSRILVLSMWLGYSGIAAGYFFEAGKYRWAVPHVGFMAVAAACLAAAMTR